MKSLYFQTVGIECKFYENQQLEYRLYSWGRSVFEKSFLQIVTHILQKAFFKHAVARPLTRTARTDEKRFLWEKSTALPNRQIIVM